MKFFKKNKRKKNEMNKKIISLSISFTPVTEGFLAVVRSTSGDDGVFIATLGTKTLVYKKSEFLESELFHAHFLKFLGFNTPMMTVLNSKESNRVTRQEPFLDAIKKSNLNIQSAKDALIATKSKRDSDSDSDSDSGSGSDSDTTLYRDASKKIFELNSEDRLLQIEYVPSSNLKESGRLTETNPSKLLQDMGQLLIYDLLVRNYDRFNLYTIYRDLFHECTLTGDEAIDFFCGNAGNFLISTDGQLVVIDTISTPDFNNSSFSESIANKYFEKLNQILENPSKLKRLCEDCVTDKLLEILETSKEKHRAYYAKEMYKGCMLFLNALEQKSQSMVSYIQSIQDHLIKTYPYLNADALSNTTRLVLMGIEKIGKRI